MIGYKLNSQIAIKFARKIESATHYTQAHEFVEITVIVAERYFASANRTKNTNFRNLRLLPI